MSSVLLPEMIRIPAGEFTMGSPESEPGRDNDEGPQHLVRIKEFELSKYAVTFAEWDAANAAGANLHRPDDKGWGRDRRPVINISWGDAQAYVRWLNTKTSDRYRLPSEAEWEYACRAGTTTAYPTGATISASDARFNSDSTAPVGSYAANAFGLYDMLGNVWEWCEDIRHENYDGAPNDGSAWTGGGGSADRVLRGGSWYDDARAVRSANRFWLERVDRDISLGFRLARTLG